MNELPDQVPELLARTFRAPSYKAIAMAILRNDHACKSLGFSLSESPLSLTVMRERKAAECNQRLLF